MALRHGRLPRRGPHHGDLHNLRAHRQGRRRRVRARAEREPRGALLQRRVQRLHQQRGLRV
ncbi:hypothetical protein LINPERHAP1_LOCUS23520 [Linum perenne]